VTLVVGADENGAHWDAKEIRLTKSDTYLFAQGVVILAFEELLPNAQSPHAPASRYFGRLPDQGIFSLELAPQLRVGARL
jgi:hypothetical protein